MSSLTYELITGVRTIEIIRNLRRFLNTFCEILYNIKIVFKYGGLYMMGFKIKADQWEAYSIAKDIILNDIKHFFFAK